jgi:exodeoxyribonuclease V alpha subunit
MPPKGRNNMQIECSHIRTLFKKPDVDFVIAVYRPLDFQELEQDFVAKGNALPTDFSLDITLEGTYTEDDKGRGPAFLVKSYTTRVKKTRGNILGYLSSGAIKGVGPALAKNIVDTFGLGAVEILEKNPERMREVSGIGEHTLQMIMESFAENREINDLMLHLGQFDISVNKARRIYKRFGAQSLEIVRNDIYTLCDVDGFGFATVDQIARKTGQPMNTLPRVKAAAVYTLQENRQNGHLYMEPEEFLEALRELLNSEDAAYQFRDDELRLLANEVLGSEKIAFKNKCVYLKQDYANEKGFAVRMAQRLACDRQRTATESPQIMSCGLSLSEEQESAVVMALKHNTCIITGGPGMGKTTVLKAFLHSYAAQCGRKNAILLCAPTGRAARRMAEATGYDACTIHRAFGLGTEDDAQATSAVSEKYDLVIIDEVSMLDMWLAHQMIARISVNTKLVLVGDKDQLPSVSSGNVLHELLRFGGIPTMQLEQVFRQAEGSVIAQNAKRITQKETNLIYDDSFILVPAASQKEANQYIRILYKRAADKLGMEKVQILTPMRKRGECSVNTLNDDIQTMMQAHREMGKKYFQQFFCENDPVMQNKNNEGVNNGDMGVIQKATSSTVKVVFPSLDTEREYDEETLKLLELAYAQTIHKSQGSEFPVVIMPVLRQHSFMLNRNLIYTAITRGKVRVVLVGQESAVKKAILTEDTTQRKTHLAGRIAVELRRLTETTAAAA